MEKVLGKIPRDFLSQILLSQLHHPEESDIILFLAVQNSSIGDSLRTVLLDRKRATLETFD